MATYEKIELSGIADGQGIVITPTATAGETIHTAHATALDEIWAFVSNLHNADVTITVEWGGVTDPDDLLVKGMVIPANSSLIPLIPGLILTNSLVFAAFASVADKLVVSGYVNRITP